MNDLVTHIQNLNAKTQAWINEDPKNRFATKLVEDLAHWAGYGVETVDQFDHFMAASDVYEVTKERYGYRPDWNRLMAMSTEELTIALTML